MESKQTNVPGDETENPPPISEPTGSTAGSTNEGGATMPTSHRDSIDMEIEFNLSGSDLDRTPQPTLSEEEEMMERAGAGESLSPLSGATEQEMIALKKAEKWKRKRANRSRRLALIAAETHANRQDVPPARGSSMGNQQSSHLINGNSRTNSAKAGAHEQPPSGCSNATPSNRQPPGSSGSANPKGKANKLNARLGAHVQPPSGCSNGTPPNHQPPGTSGSANPKGTAKNLNARLGVHAQPPSGCSKGNPQAVRNRPNPVKSGSTAPKRIVKPTNQTEPLPGCSHWQSDNRQEQNTIQPPMTTTSSSGNGSSNQDRKGGVEAKRQRSQNNSPHDAPARKKLAKKPSYSEVARRSLIVLIRRDGDFNQATHEDLQNLLCERLDQTPAGATRPTFESNSVQNGVVRFVCSNEASRDWLLNEIQGLGSLNGSRMWTTTEDAERSRPRMILTVPSSSGEPIEIIFKRLRESNPGLDTSTWSYGRDYANSRGRTILVFIDQVSADFIIGRGRKLYYQLQRLIVEVRKGDRSGAPTNPQ